MQRRHRVDLTGHLLQKGGWTLLALPALAEKIEVLPIGTDLTYSRAPGEVLDQKREPLDVLEQIKSDIGSYAFVSQYQQSPVPPEGNLVRWSWFRTYGTSPWRQLVVEIVLRLDTAP